jgi:DNA-3-methyladenine glycosylase
MPRPAMLDAQFFARSVHDVAPDLIGATLLYRGVGGIIVEVEAYHHTEPAAHSFGGKRPRNAVMYGPPAHAYVYRSYGLHWCFNFVCEPEGSAGAVLLRALEPTEGLAAMRRRRGQQADRLLCSGPGRLCEALGITGKQNGARLAPPDFVLHPREHVPDIAVGVRVGISKAADLPWRYGLRNSPFLSKPFREK